jgi:ApeA N-terminal domain 1
MLVDKLLEKKIGDEFALTGMWWVPTSDGVQNPESKSFGTLTFTSDGKFRLCTVGVLRSDQLEKNELPNIVAEGPPAINVVWGRSATGESITLFDCLNVLMPFDLSNGTGTLAAAYEAGTVLVTKSKKWFANVEDVGIDEIRLRYKHLRAWVSSSGISSPKAEEIYGMEKGGRLYLINSPFVLQTVDIGDYVIYLRVGYNLTFNSIAISEPEDKPALTYNNDTFISIKPKEGKITLSESKRLERTVWHFLSLMMGQRTHIESFECIIKNSDKKADFDTVMVFPRIRATQRIEKVKQSNMLFTYREIEGLFKSTLRKMFVAEMQPLYNQFFAELLNPSVYSEDEFMAAIRAIEVFHRRAVGGNYVTKDDYERYEAQFADLVDALLEQSDFETLDKPNEKAFKKSLNQRLKYAYQFSLNKRLKDVLGDQAVFLEVFVDKNANSKVQNYFTNKIVKTRNYYTHYDDDDKKEAITDPIELKLMSQRLIVLLYMLLLHYVGIPKDDVDAAIRKHAASMYSRFGYLKPY